MKPEQGWELTMKKRNTKTISDQDVVEQRTSQTSCGPIRLAKVRTRWFVSAVDLGQALGFNVGWSAEKGVYIETK